MMLDVKIVIGAALGLLAGMALYDSSKQVKSAFKKGKQAVVCVGEKLIAKMKLDGGEKDETQCGGSATEDSERQTAEKQTAEQKNADKGASAKGRKVIFGLN